MTSPISTPAWQVRAVAVIVAAFLLGPLVVVLPISFTDRNYLSLPSAVS